MKVLLYSNLSDTVKPSPKNKIFSNKRPSNSSRNQKKREEFARDGGHITQSVMYLQVIFSFVLRFYFDLSHLGQLSWATRTSGLVSPTANSVKWSLCSTLTSWLGRDDWVVDEDYVELLTSWNQSITETIWISCIYLVSWLRSLRIEVTEWKVYGLQNQGTMAPNLSSITFQLCDLEEGVCLNSNLFPQLWMVNENPSLMVR